MNLRLKWSLINDLKHSLMSRIWSADLAFSSVKVTQNSILRQQLHFINTSSSTPVRIWKPKSILRAFISEKLPKQPQSQVVYLYSSPPKKDQLHHIVNSAAAVLLPEEAICTYLRFSMYNHSVQSSPERKVHEILYQHWGGSRGQRQGNCRKALEIVSIGLCC